ncbi:MAG: ribbon-helix-helix protein, CopG family [bacterium]|nr:ribbon-helix-helix protein, CopG family [bacterium]
MKRTTFYLPDELKQRLEEVAQRESRSEASIVREAVQVALDSRDPPIPKLPLFDGWGDPTLADRVDELLAGSGFGR